MRANVIPAAELTADLRGQWAAALFDNPLLQTPVLRPELFQIVGRFNPRTFVAVVEEPGCPPVFLPFNRTLRRVDSFAGPVPICDYQAIMTSANNHVSVREVLREARARWRALAKACREARHAARAAKRAAGLDGLNFYAESTS